MPVVKIPEIGNSYQEIVGHLKELKKKDLKWQEGKAFCLMYYPGDEKAAIIQHAYLEYFNENAFNPMAFPSLRKLESEVVSMVKNLLHGKNEVKGSMTSGGTESILMAVKTARDFSLKINPEIKPEIILPVSAHPAFQKACEYFSVKPLVVGLDAEFKADMEQVRSAITPNTIMLVGSAPAYPHGIIDPIEELSDLAIQKNLLLHVDACIGAFLLPFLEKNGHEVPHFDFRLEGVSSISADIHKYGYAAKGASVVLYRSNELRRSQFFIETNWPGGIYASSTITGSRPGGAISAAWAALSCIGIDGYCQFSKLTMEAFERIKMEIERIPELRILGNPQHGILSFTSSQIDIYQLADELQLKGWHFERLQFPAAIHLTVSQIHSTVAALFIQDLQRAILLVKKAKVRKLSSRVKINSLRKIMRVVPEGLIAKWQSKMPGKSPTNQKRTAPLYGMMGALKGTKDLERIVLNLMDKLNK